MIGDSVRSDSHTGRAAAAAPTLARQSATRARQGANEIGAEREETHYGYQEVGEGRADGAYCNPPL